MYIYYTFYICYGCVTGGLTKTHTTSPRMQDWSELSHASIAGLANHIQRGIIQSDYIVWPMVTDVRSEAHLSD